MTQIAPFARKRMSILGVDRSRQHCHSSGGVDGPMTEPPLPLTKPPAAATVAVRRRRSRSDAADRSSEAAPSRQQRQQPSASAGRVGGGRDVLPPRPPARPSGVALASQVARLLGTSQSHSVPMRLSSANRPPAAIQLLVVRDPNILDSWFSPLGGSVLTIRVEALLYRAYRRSAPFWRRQKQSAPQRWLQQSGRP